MERKPLGYLEPHTIPQFIRDCFGTGTHMTFRVTIKLTEIEQEGQKETWGEVLSTDFLQGRRSKPNSYSESRRMTAERAGKPLGLLPPESIPAQAKQVYGPGTVLAIMTTGQLVDLEAQTGWFEIHDSTLM